MEKNSDNEDYIERSEDKSAGPVAQSIHTITRETKKIMKKVVVPGVASVGAISTGYLLLMGRTMYSTLTMLMGLGMGSHKLDPATLMDYWEREGGKRPDELEKSVNRMFGK